MAKSSWCELRDEVCGVFEGVTTDSFSATDATVLALHLSNPRWGTLPEDLTLTRGSPRVACA